GDSSPPKPEDDFVRRDAAPDGQVQLPVARDLDGSGADGRDAVGPPLDVPPCPFERRLGVAPVEHRLDLELASAVQDVERQLAREPLVKIEQQVLAACAE